MQHQGVCATVALMTACACGGEVQKEIVYVYGGSGDGGGSNAGSVMPPSTATDAGQPPASPANPPVMPSAPDSSCDPACAVGETCYEGRCYPPAQHDDLDERFPESTAFEAFPGADAVCREITFAVTNRPSSPLMLLSDISAILRQRILEWGAHTCISARELPPDRAAAADVVLSFVRGEHGDGMPFDGPGRVLCHAGPDTDAFRALGIAGEIHCDDEEPWAPLALPFAPPYELGYTLLHELGHVFGLAHEPDIRDAVMFNYYTLPHPLHTDDIAGIQDRCGTLASCAASPPPPPVDCSDGQTRSCSTACGTGAERCAGGRWSGTCDGPRPNVCGTCESTRSCATSCGSGLQRCDGGGWTTCSAPTTCCGDGSCNEDRASCRADCPVRCGDGICDPGESCSADCGDCRDGDTRPCDAACGTGTQRCVSRRWSATCEGPESNTCGECADSRPCSTACGSGTERCESSRWVGCTAPQPNPCGTCASTRSCATSCGAGTESCVGGAWSGCSAPAQNSCGTCSDTRECTNSCGNRGTQRCSSGSWSTCEAAVCEPCGNGRCGTGESHASCPRDCNQAPVISGTTCPSSATVGEAVTYAASGHDPDGDAVTCTWADDHGNTLPGCTVSGAWRSEGPQRFTVTARDPYGGSASAACTTMVRAACTPSTEVCDSRDNDCDGSTDEDLADRADGCGGSTNNTSGSACMRMRPGSDTACVTTPAGAWSDADYVSESVATRLLGGDEDWYLFQRVDDCPVGSFDPDAAFTVPGGMTAQLCLIHRRADGRSYTPTCSAGGGASFTGGYVGCCDSGSGALHVRWRIDSDGVLNNAGGTFYVQLRALSGGSCNTGTLTVDF